VSFLLGESVMTVEEVKDSVIVAPQAFVLMALHAAQHSTSAVHGLLIGSRSENKIQVSGAFPVCHETPTKLLVETALALVQSTMHNDNDKSASASIVGWFTAPEMLADNKPGPVALRIAANLATDSNEPVLLVLRNEIIGQLINGEETSASAAIQAFGKNFGQQWMDPLEVSVLQETDATRATKELHEEGTSINDLVDHWQNGASSDWCETLATITNKCF
jgi:hypothetical protein